jgi:hypothetical protein
MKLPLLLGGLCFCLAFLLPAPPTPEPTFSFHGVAPVTGELPVQPGVWRTMHEHHLGEFVVPPLPEGASLGDHVLLVSRVTSQTARIAWQNRGDDSHWGWEWNTCSDPVGAALEYRILVRRAKRPETAYIWQHNELGLVLGMTPILSAGSTSPAWTHIEPTFEALLAADEAGDTSVWSGTNLIDGMEATEFSHQHAVAGLPPGTIAEVVVYTAWRGSEEGFGWPQHRRDVQAWEWTQHIDLTLEWSPLP